EFAYGQGLGLVALSFSSPSQGRGHRQHPPFEDGMLLRPVSRGDCVVRAFSFATAHHHSERGCLHSWLLCRIFHRVQVYVRYFVESSRQTITLIGSAV